MKHAILVMAHGNLSVLQKCMQLLDDERFDFFIHMDAKSKDNGHWLSEVCHKSKVVFTDRVAVYWGHHSQVEATLMLLKSAYSEEYSYYHLISAVDMPLKTPNEIFNFFKESPAGTEYINTRGKDGSNDWRMKYRYPFLKCYSRTQSDFLNNVQKFLYTRVLRFPRKKGTSIIRDKGWSVHMGDLWWSITGDFCKQIIEISEEIMPYWKDCYVSDETFAQTVIMNNEEYKERKSNFKTRLIDWGRGRPYTYREEDYDLMMSSSALFVRKLDPNDLKTTDMIFKTLIDRK